MKKLLEGITGSIGIASGSAKIITGESDMDKIKKGDVLVAKFTTPNFTPIFIKVLAIVTDTGGMTSHAAIVARELGIPAVVGTGDATKKLANGMQILVKAEGIKGEIFNLDGAERNESR